MATIHHSPSLVLALVLGTWPALSSCLSIEEVPRISAPGSGSACFQRGKYTMGDWDFAGLTDTCTGSAVCVDDSCGPLPPCTASADLHECKFTPPLTQSAVGTYAMAGEYVYWTELGTLDARNNLQKDGALARARIGDWQREELEKGLDFRDGGQGKARGTTLRIIDDHLFLGTSTECCTSYFYRSLSGGESLRELPGVTEVGCISGNQQFFVKEGTLFKRQLNSKDAPLPISDDLGSQTECAAVIGDSVFLGGKGQIRRVRTTEPVTSETFPTEAVLVGAYGSVLIIRREAWMARFDPNPDEEDSFEWENAAGGASGEQHTIQGDYVYWYRNSTSRQRKYEVVLRGRLDGQGDQQVVAEVWDQIAREDDVPQLGVGTKGVGWWSKANPEFLHFRPLPSPSPIDTK